MNDPRTILDLLASPTIAVIGLSDDPTKPSNYVSAYMQSHGHRIYPINPSLTAVLGEPGLSIPRRPAGQTRPRQRLPPPALHSLPSSMR